MSMTSYNHVTDRRVVGNFLSGP